MDISWNEEVDVVVVGYGLSGAVAAIEAHDAGARVLILEKGEYPGGLSILAGGAVTCAHDVEATTEYLTQTSGGRLDDNLIGSFAQGLVDVEQYVRKLAEVNNARVVIEAMPHMGLPVYPFAGRDTFYFVRVLDVPGFKGFSWVQRLKPAGVNLMKVAMDNIEVRQINVLLSTPAKRLVTGGNSMVIGVVAESAGKEIAMKARCAVILACGGFEQNQ